MLKKILFALLSISIFSAQASTQVEGLKTVMDELSYSLTVDWNQQDLAARDNILSNFHIKITELKRNGLTDEDVIDFAHSTIKDKALLGSLQLTADQYKNNLISFEQFISKVSEAAQSSQLKGSSWSQHPVIGIFYLGVGILILAITGAPLRTCSGPCN